MTTAYEKEASKLMTSWKTVTKDDQKRSAIQLQDLYPHVADSRRMYKKPHDRYIVWEWRINS